MQLLDWITIICFHVFIHIFVDLFTNNDFMIAKTSWGTGRGSVGVTGLCKGGGRG